MLMLKLVKDSNQVKKLYAEFRKLLDSKVNFPMLRQDFHLGHQGGGIEDDSVRFAPDHGIWVSAGRMQWNAFGVEDIQSMVVQINFQDYVNEYRRIGAAFALDEFDNPFVVHRGHIGGGRPGVGLSLMLANCRSARETLVEGERQPVDCFVVGQLRSKYFIDQVADFVREVKRVKALTSHPDAGATASPNNSLFSLDSRTFSGEKSGASTRNYEGTVDRTHGLVVNALAKQLSSIAAKLTWQVTNDRHRDLMLVADNELKVLFEVKTTVTLQSVCTGLGQLLLHSATAQDASLVLVLPEKPSTDIAHQLKARGVKLLYYKWQRKQPHFSSLGKLIAAAKEQAEVVML